MQTIDTNEWSTFKHYFVLDKYELNKYESQEYITDLWIWQFRISSNLCYYS